MKDYVYYENLNSLVFIETYICNQDEIKYQWTSRITVNKTPPHQQYSNLSTFDISDMMLLHPLHPYLT